MAQQNDNSGVLFRNDRKEKPNHPDYTGNCIINGKELRVSAWIKEGKKGKFMSMAYSEPYQREERQPKAQEMSDRGTFDDMDDDVPF